MTENAEELNAEMSAIESEHATGATFEEYEAMWVVLTEKKGWSPSRAHGYLLARLYNRLYGQCEALKAKVDRQAGRIENLETALKPFHAWACEVLEEYSDHDDDIVAASYGGKYVRFGDLRRLRSVFSEKQK